MQLYNLVGQYAQLVNMADELDPQVLSDTLEGIADMIEDKAENIAYVIKSIEADVKVLKEEENRLKERRTALENKVASMKQYLFEQLSAAGIDKVKRPKITVSIANNPVSVDVLEEALIPGDYFVQQAPAINKKAILEQLKAGEEIPGCGIKQSKSLRIR